MASLLILAAGLGSRYGGLKQMDPVGSNGATVLDYAVFDAIRAGFDRVIFVIRRDFEAIFREQIGAKYAGRIAVDYVFQSLEALPPGWSPPPGREKPWGTGHAVWCAREAIAGNFAVINADDFYGADSFAQLARFLARPMGSQTPQFAMVGFRLAQTLSEHGSVSRGIAVAEGGRLRSLVEQTGIDAAEVGSGRKYTGAEIVSMNCWGFTPALYPALDRQFRDFLKHRAGEPRAEFYLPAAVAAMIEAGEAVVDVLPTASSWFGITYREDQPRVKAAVADLVARGLYPAQLV
jgi:UTP-glucose-1-phosphate uridylyltransferase